MDSFQRNMAVMIIIILHRFRRTEDNGEHLSAKWDSEDNGRQLSSKRGTGDNVGPFSVRRGSEDNDSGQWWTAFVETRHSG